MEWGELIARRIRIGTNNDQDCERSVKTKGQGEWSQAKERENQRLHEIELGLIEHKASIRKNTKRARLRV